MYFCSGDFRTGGIQKRVDSDKVDVSVQWHPPPFHASIFFPHYLSVIDSAFLSPFSSPRRGCRGSCLNGRSFRGDPIVPTERVYPGKKSEPDGERGDRWLIVLLVTSYDSSAEGKKSTEEAA